MLECDSQPLSQRILQFAEQARAQSIARVQIVPLFLLPGVHVMQDIPTAVQQAQQHISTPAIELVPYLGAAAMLPRWLQQQLAPVTAEARLVVAHGSRRPQGNEPVEVLAQMLDATVAYWAIQPSFADQVERLYGQGYRWIVVLPYILFPGGMSQGLIQQSAQLTQRWPQLQLTILPCLAEEDGLVELLLNHSGLLDRPRSAGLASVYC
jgi:sirohydrochlorin ferrochelatase